MFEVAKQFEPLDIYMKPAIRKAIAAGESYCVEVGTTVNRQKLHEAALEVWTLYVRVMHSKLLPKEVRETLPPLYAQEQERDPMVYVKFFTPAAGWTWFATEFDGLNTFFGYVIGQVGELGYFLLSELEDYTDPLSIRIERDLYFTPCRLSQAEKEQEEISGVVVEMVCVIDDSHEVEAEQDQDPGDEVQAL
jgi:hypothetical protein